MGRIDDIVSQLVSEMKLADEKIETEDEKIERESRMLYKSSQKILLVGEGDFSFATSLAHFFGISSNLFATSLDSYSQVLERYAEAKSNIKVLKEKGCVVLHEVDAHKMTQHPILRKHHFDVIVFNFPHAQRLYPESNQLQIELHRELVRGFLKSAYELVRYEGQVHITHKTAYPYDRWNIRELAKEARMEFVVETEFNSWNYPGYCIKRGEAHGSRCDEPFFLGDCSTFIISIVSTL